MANKANSSPRRYKPALLGIIEEQTNKTTKDNTKMIAQSLLSKSFINFIIKSVLH